MNIDPSNTINRFSEGPFFRHDDAVKAGWFSRRHRTSEAHRNAQDRRQARIDASKSAARARQVKADERKAIRMERAA